MYIQIKSAIFWPSDPIFTLSFLHNFKTVCERNRIHHEKGLWHFAECMKEPAKAALTYRLSATEDKDTQKRENDNTFSSRQLLTGNLCPK